MARVSGGGVGLSPACLRCVSELGCSRCSRCSSVGALGAVGSRCSRNSAVLSVARDSGALGASRSRGRASGSSRQERAGRRQSAARRMPGSCSALTRSASSTRAAWDSGASNSDDGAAAATPSWRRPARPSSTSRDSRSASRVTSAADRALPVEHAALDHQQRIGLGEVTQALGGLDRVAGDEGDRRRTRRSVVERVDARVLGRDPGQRVLHHGVGGALARVRGAAP